MISNQQPIGERRCPVCHKPVRPNPKNTSAIKAGGRSLALIHDTCAKALNAEVEAYQAQQYRGISEDWSGRMAQVGVGGTLNGGESGVGRVQVINKPCVVCQQQVTTGTTLEIGGNTYAAHMACKQRALESIASALDPGNLINNHRDSLLEGVGE